MHSLVSISYCNLFADDLLIHTGKSLGYQMVFHAPETQIPIVTLIARKNTTASRFAYQWKEEKHFLLCVIIKQNTINSWVQSATDWSRIHLWSSLPPCIQKKRSISLKNFATCSRNICYFHFHGFSVVFDVWKSNKITPKIDVSKALFYSIAPTMWEHWTCTRRKSSSTFFLTTVLHPNKIIKFSSRRGIW